MGSESNAYWLDLPLAVLVSTMACMLHQSEKKAFAQVLKTSKRVAGMAASKGESEELAMRSLHHKLAALD